MPRQNIEWIRIMTGKLIKVRVETHYGRNTIYPVCDKALCFARIAGTKTLTTQVCALIQELGYEIESIYAANYLPEVSNG